ncbi:MAG: hypothetical protein EG825_02640 [Rhodocyclaceae bacterium]|nr:hypothetical protein [Rhodocyclaceae bacterium]
MSVEIYGPMDSDDVEYWDYFEELAKKRDAKAMIIPDGQTLLDAKRRMIESRRGSGSMNKQKKANRLSM